MRTALLICFLMLCSTFAFAVSDFSKLVNKRKFWNIKKTEFLAKFPGNIFTKVSQNSNSLQYMQGGNRREIFWKSLPAMEVVASFSQEQQLQSITINLINKADNNSIAKKRYRSLIRDLARSLDKLCGKSTARKTTRLVNKQRLLAKKWVGKNCIAVLKWSYTGHTKSKFRVEYITLLLLSKQSGSVDPASQQQNRVIQLGKDLSYKKRMERRRDGSLILKIPMIDQGSRGYCVAASIARILNYYGLKIGQHEVAAAANTDPSSGTTFYNIKATLDSSGLKFRFYAKELALEPLYQNTLFAFKLLPKYNSLAAKQNKEELKKSNYIAWKNGRKFYCTKNLLDAMDDNIFIDLRLKDKVDYRQFVSGVTKAINSGYPVVWAIQFGIFSGEKWGKHVRIINGLNQAKEQLFFTDSWGLGHECKPESFERAWSRTIAAYAIIPRRK